MILETVQQRKQLFAFSAERFRKFEQHVHKLHNVKLRMSFGIGQRRRKIGGKLSQQNLFLFGNGSSDCGIFTGSGEDFTCRAIQSLEILKFHHNVSYLVQQFINNS